jgi:hypothetical protein
MASAELTEVMQQFLRSSQVLFLYFKSTIAFFLVWIIVISPVLAKKITPETQALFESVRNGNMDGVEKNISAGADWTWRNVDGLTPIDIAINYNHFKIAHYLLALRKKTQRESLPRTIDNSSNQVFPMRVDESKRSTLLEKRDVNTKQKITLEKSVSSKLEGINKKIDTKIINLNQYRVDDSLVSFFENNIEVIKRSIKQKSFSSTNPPADKIADFETKISPLSVKTITVKSKSLSSTNNLLKIKKPNPIILDRLTSFLSNTIDMPKRSNIFKDSVKSESKDSVKSELSPKLAISEENLVKVARSEKVSSVDKLMIQNDASPSVIDRITDFFASGARDTKVSLIKDSPVVQESIPNLPVAFDDLAKSAKPNQVSRIDKLMNNNDSGQGVIDRITDFFTSAVEDSENTLMKDSKVALEPFPNLPVSSEALARSAKSIKAPIIETLVIEKDLSPSVIDKFTSFYYDKTEKKTRSLKSEVLVIPKPDLIVAVVPQSEPLSKQVEPKLAVVENNSTKTLERRSEKIKSSLNISQKALGVKRSKVVSDMERIGNPVLGKSLSLGNILKVGSENICINKSLHHLSFCLENVDWPKKIIDAFRVSTKLFQGTQALVEYKKGKIKQVHILFHNRYFNLVVTYFTQRLGVVGKEFDNLAIIPAEPNRRNQTFRWRGPGKSILEIRQIDDLRWSSLPDTRHGVIRIYVEDPAPVFRHVSWSDFTLARILDKRKKFCREAKIVPCPW